MSTAPDSLLTFSGRRHLVAKSFETHSRSGQERYCTARCNSSITMDPDYYQEPEREIGQCKRCYPAGWSE